MENQNKSVAFQWVIPSAILMVVVLILLFNFSNKSSRNASELIYKEFVSKTEDYGTDFYGKLTVVKSIAAPLADLLEIEGTDDADYVQQILEVAANCSQAYKAFYCDQNGDGYDQTGTDISIGDTTYFQTVIAPDTVYAYAKADEGLDQDSIVVKTVVKKHGYLLLYYPLQEFDGLLAASDTDPFGYLMLLDEEGNVLAISGSKNVFDTGMNVIDSLSEDNLEASRTIRNRFKNGTRGTTEVNLGGKASLLTYVPFGANHWEMVMGVSKSYADRQIALQWQSTKQMLIQLIAVIFIFICIVMVVNIVAKISSNEKKKQLEDKADTDLLTGLNNKLATERKIKDYMAQNPKTQSMMFLLDIDNFKKINDTMGHAFGDEVLRSLGQQIGANFRATDIIGRIGGDEFMIFLKGIEDETVIRKEAKKIENFFKGFQAGEYVKYAATASIGAAIFPHDGADFETLYKAADQGLYKAKKRGKNQLAFYKDEWAGIEPEKKEK